MMNVELKDKVLNYFRKYTIYILNPVKNYKNGWRTSLGFMNWDKPILTDDVGFKFFSLRILKDNTEIVI